LVALAVLCTPAFGQTTTIFDNWNKGSVDSNPTDSTSFTISEPQMITYIDTYHWNYGQGTSSGGTISLQKDDGETFGPWTVTAESGSGVANVWWISHPNVVIPAGTYTIIDSEQETWSKNSESNDCGFSKVEGHPEKAADVTPDSGKETEAAFATDEALGNKENKIPVPSTFTSTQEDFLKAVKEDLRKIGKEKTAENLEKYIAEGHATIGKEDPGTLASTKSPTLGYLDPISSNNLIINQESIDQWATYRERAAKFQESGDPDKEETSLRNARQAIRDMAFTLIHEDVHMGQYAPQQIPKDENPAYETTIREERRVINEDMQEIREIQGRGAKLPGDQDRLNELIEDLKISRNVYQEHINSMQSDVIETEIVDPEKFKTSKADMDKLYEEAGDLIKSVGIKEESVVLPGPAVSQDSGSRQDVNFLVFRTLATSSGTYEQMCNHYQLTVLKEGLPVDLGVGGGTAESTNGLLTLSLTPGDYSYRIDFRYTMPPDAGVTDGSFTVSGGSPTTIKVDT